MDNAFRFLIMSEGGATAYLATALAAPVSGKVTPYHRAVWTELRRRLPVTLSDDGPRDVLVENGNLDLVLLWDDWCLVFEVKVRSGSIRQGQLQEYYDRLRNGPIPLANLYSSALRVAIGFITPGRIGDKEFRSLSVEAPDEKFHISWEDLLTAIDVALEISATDVTQAPTFFDQLIRAGSKHVRELLIEIKKRPGAVVIEEDRLARKQFALDVQTCVVQRRPDWRKLFRPPWSDPTFEEIYLSLDDTRQANAYFTVFSSSVVLPDDADPSSLQVRWWFKVADKHRRALAPAFLNADHVALVTEMGLPPKLASDVEFDDRRLSLTLHAQKTGPRSELLDNCASVLERFVITFQRLFS